MLKQDTKGGNERRNIRGNIDRRRRYGGEVLMRITTSRYLRLFISVYFNLPEVPNTEKLSLLF